MYRQRRSGSDGASRRIERLAWPGVDVSEKREQKDPSLTRRRAR